VRGELGKDRGKTGGKRTGLKQRVLNLGPVRKILLALYNKIFSWYYS
jgi:hypothetical protein